jgi:Na+-transporting NADH:ubiquinone oxidoreductase subunit NqrF
LQITIVGLASQKQTTINVSENDLEKNLLVWLRENQIHIASSCSGEGVCKKCVIQKDWLSCKFTLKTFFEREPSGKIFISYL